MSDAASDGDAGPFHLVYTGIGALRRLLSAVRWAETVAGLLQSEGERSIRKAHPVPWALDDLRPDELPMRALPYFETAGCTSPRSRRTSVTASR